MDISVIVPIYKGQKYIPSIQKMVSLNVEYATKQGHPLEIELLLINDYPNETIHVDDFNREYEIVVVENEKNSGIHQTRVNGLKKAKGEYILFLDQDDLIEDNCLLSQFLAIEGFDLVVGNGYRMFGDKKMVIYKDDKKMDLVFNEKIYLKAANQIVSPGHCLIRKSSIPKEWREIIIKHNGGDDMFLWLLLFSNKKKISLNKEKVYTHVDTGTNVSSNRKIMLESANAVVNASIESGIIEKEVYEAYKRRIAFLDSFYIQHKGMRRLVDLMKYIDIVAWKIYARLI